MTPEDRLVDLLVRWEEAGGTDTPEDLCRDCPADLPAFRDLLARLGHVGFAPGTGPIDPPPAGFSAGRYVAREFHAGGGQGWVYRGHDTELNRPVAVKVRNDSATGDRFRAEAELTGRLAHPGVVPVHGRGRTGTGREFYAMRFVDGPTLRDAARRFHDSPPADPADRNVELRRLVRAVAAVCETVAYAHAQGVIHRDLKPANVMLGSFGEVLVLDWGLAKDVRTTEGVPQDRAAEPDSEAPHAEETRTGSAKGSPAFMSPEQARGDWPAVGPAADVFSLGATLYYVLTGRPPFDGRTDGEVIRRVREGVFPPPREVNSDVPQALDAVCRKAMAPSPAARYASAHDLAADLDRWLADEPVSAWREPVAVRARRWVKRHRLAVTGVVAALAVGLVAAVVVAVLQRFSNEALAVMNDDLDAANIGLGRTNAELVRANTRESAARADAETQKDRANANLTRARETLHIVRMNSAATALAAGQPELAWSLIRQALPEPGVRDDPRGFEWFHTWHLFDHPPLRTVRGPARPKLISISADGSRLAVWGGSGDTAELAVFDLKTGAKLKSFPGLFPRDVIPASRDLTLFAVPERTGVRLWQLLPGNPPERGRLLTPAARVPQTIAVSPDGTAVAAAVDRARVVVWAASDGTVRHDFRDFGEENQYQHWTVEHLSFSRDGTLLGLTHALKPYVFDLRTGFRFSPTFAARGTLHNLWFTEADTLVVATGEDPLDARPVADLRGLPPATPRKYPSAPRWTAGVSEYPDDDRGLVTVLAGDGLVRAYFAPFVPVRFPFPGQPPTQRPGDPIPMPFEVPFAAVAFGSAPDGQVWAVAAADGTVTAFAGPTPAGLGVFVPHPGAGAVYSVGFVAGGGIVTQAQDLSVAAGVPGGRPAWGWSPPPSPLGFSVPFGPVAGLAASADGTRVAYRTPDKGVRVADAGTGRALADLPLRTDASLQQPAVPVVFLPGGRAVYANPVRPLLSFTKPVTPQAAEVVTWDVDAGKLLSSRAVPAWVRGLAVTADGRQVVSASEDGWVRVWDADRSGPTPARAYRAAGELWSVAVSADGSRLAAGARDGTVWVWEAGKTEPARVPVHRGTVLALAFAPDGRSLVSGGYDGTVRFLDLGLMQERFGFSTGAGVEALAFAPGGGVLAVAGGDGAVRLLRTTTPAAVVETCRRRAAAAPTDPTAHRDLVAALWALHLDRVRAKDRTGARRALEDAVRAAEAAGDRADAKGWLAELKAALATPD